MDILWPDANRHHHPDVDSNVHSASRGDLNPVTVIDSYAYALAILALSGAQRRRSAFS